MRSYAAAAAGWAFSLLAFCFELAVGFVTVNIRK
jgi:hypothetical protein